MDDARFAELERRRERNAYFAGLEQAAVESQHANPPKKARSTAVMTPEERAAKKRATEAARRERLKNDEEYRARRREADRKAKAKRRAGRPRKYPFDPQRVQVALDALGFTEPLPFTPGKPPEHCIACRRPMRRKTAEPTGRPGEVTYVGQGMCTTCYRGGPKKPGPQPVDYTKLRCVRCDRGLRHTLQRAADFPGTRSFAARDESGAPVCNTCNAREKRHHKPREPRATHCGRCKAPLAYERPVPEGHKAHGGKGYCAGCASALRRARMRADSKS